MELHLEMDEIISSKLAKAISILQTDKGKAFDDEELDIIKKAFALGVFETITEVQNQQEIQLEKELQNLKQELGKNDEDK